MGVSETNLGTTANLAGGIAAGRSAVVLYTRIRQAIKAGSYTYAIYSVHEILTNQKLSAAQKSLLITQKSFSYVDPTGATGYLPIRSVIDHLNDDGTDLFKAIEVAAKDAGFGPMQKIVVVFEDP